MGLISRVVFKSYLQKGDKPTESEFSDIADTVYLKSEETLFAKGGDVFGENSKIGLIDNYALDVVTNNLTRGRVHANGRLTWGTITDAGFLADFNGNIRNTGNNTVTNGKIFFDNTTLGIQIQDSTAYNSSIDIGQGNGGIPTAGNRHLKVGTNNTVKDGSVLVSVVGYSNNLAGLPSYSVINGTSQNLANGNGPSETAIMVGQSNAIAYTATAETSSIVIGRSCNMLHAYSLCMGVGSETTAQNQLIISSSQSNINNSGLNDIYFGTGVRSKRLNQTAGNIVINGSGAANAADKAGGSVTIAGGKSTGNAASPDVIFATATPGSSGSTLQSLTNRWWVKGGTGQLANVSSPNASAVFQIDSTTGGLLPPRMTTTQRDAISAPAEGLEVYNLTTHKKQVYDGTTWQDCF